MVTYVISSLSFIKHASILAHAVTEKSKGHNVAVCPTQDLDVCWHMAGSVMGRMSQWIIITINHCPTDAGV